MVDWLNSDGRLLVLGGLGCCTGAVESPIELGRKSRCGLRV